MILPFLFDKLEIVCKIDQGGSWIRIISKSLLTFKRVSVKNLFFPTFLKKS